MAGTGLYSAKATPNHLDDTQNGAPVLQVITLVTGGLGVLDFWAGGYVTNATRVETRSIVSHTDNTITLEGALGAWLNTDDLDIFDSWATIQGALDRLWTDQAAVAFTASQYIRVFAGTYDEIPTPNAGLNPREIDGTQLIIEGDPADDRANIVIAPTAGTDGMFVNCDSALIRHLTITKAAATYGIRTSPGGFHLQVEDVAINMTVGAGANYGVYTSRILSITDSFVTLATNNGVSVGVWCDAGGCWVKRCTIKMGGAGRGIRSDNPTNVNATEVYNADVVFGITNIDQYALHTFHNCTFYNCTNGLWIAGRSYTIPRFDVINCIFKDVGYPYMVEDAWPEETSTYCGPHILQRNNCYHNYTAYAKQFTGGATRTYVQWVAMNRVDANGDLDATDPLMTAPATGDFSLLAASPCRRAGVGSGVPYDVEGDAFDPYHPDIGAVTTGTGLWRKPEELLEQE